MPLCTVSRRTLLLLGAAVVILAAVLSVGWLWLATPPSPDDLARRAIAPATIIYDRHGRMLYEMEGVSEEQAREAMRLAAAKLSVKTTFVTRTVR